MKILKLSLAASLLIFSASTAFAEGLVLSSEGAAVLVRGTEEIAANPGTPIQNGDVVKTPAGSSADISLNGLAGARVLAGGETVVNETATEGMRLTIRSGNAILNLAKLPAASSFSVETPTAIASVRGTQFWGRVEMAADRPITTFAVREGIVEIFAKGASKAFTLEKGQALDIPDNTDAPVIRPALPGEMDAMAQADSIRTSA